MAVLEYQKWDTKVGGKASVWKTVDSSRTLLIDQAYLW